ncbi:MAG TPA: hypothetical protein VIQ81_04480 [Gammaproteobacteria bacterium]
MQIKSGLTLSLMALLLNACALPSSTDPDSFLYSVPVGSVLELKQDFPVKAQTARTFMQSGRIVEERALNIYYPHCSLRTNTLHDYDRIIKPTRFEIYRVVDDEEHAQRYLQYAARLFGFGSDGPTIIGQSSYYYLRSADEPDVRSLICLQWGSPESVKYLSINQVRAVLGGIFTLHIKP